MRHSGIRLPLAGSSTSPVCWLLAVGVLVGSVWLVGCHDRVVLGTYPDGTIPVPDGSRDTGIDVVADVAPPDQLLPDQLQPDQPSPPQAWAVSFGETASTTFYDTKIAVDTAGNSYVTGPFYNTATFGSTTLSPKGDSDVFVAKLSPSGTFLWAVSAGGSGGDSGRGIAVDNAGNSYVTGYFAGTATFGSTTLTSKGNKDVFVAKLSPSGTFLWAVSPGGSVGDTLGGAMVVDSAGNSYVTGYFYDTVTFGSTTLTSNGIVEVFVAKLSPSGAFLWAVSAGGSAPGFIQGISLDSAGNSYVTGFFSGTATFGSTTLTAKDKSDVFVAKLSPSGAFLWAVSAGGIGSDNGSGIAVDSAGNSYITGSFWDTATFGSITLLLKGPGDIYVAKLSPSGTFLWAVNTRGSVVGGADSVDGDGIGLDSAGNSYVTGFFQGTVTFGATTLFAKGKGDVFAAKLSPSGKFLWAVSAGGSSGDYSHDRGTGIGLDNAGNSYVTGMFGSPATFGSTTLSTKEARASFVWRIPAQP